MSGQQQQQQQPRYDNSAGSRASVASMPMITETGEINRAIPKVPLRVPMKNPRRSLPNGGVSALPPLNVPSPNSSYVPPSPMSKEEIMSEADTAEPYSAGMSTPPAFMEKTVEDEKHWVGHRERRCKFLALVGILTAVIVGLAVGLSVGLSKHSSDSGSSSASGDGDTSAGFPAGSFSLDAYLRSNSTGCTSRKTTWNCYPDTDGGRTTFHWTITTPDSKSYKISADETPFSKGFSGLPMTMLDNDKDSERLVFAFSANRTVVPSDANTPTNRAANCTYPGTVFQATLWTRRRGQETITPPKGLSDFAAWPGDVEVFQFKNSTIGQPYCMDKFGGSIADVQAAGGSCECRYSSSSLQ